MNIRERTLAAFKIEYADHLTHIRSELARFETGTVTPGDDVLFEIYRRAHSLKGAARAAGLETVEILAHEMESLFSAMRDGSRLLDLDAIKIVGKVLDSIEDWVLGLDDDADQVDTAPVLAEIQAYLAFAPVMDALATERAADSAPMAAGGDAPLAQAEPVPSRQSMTGLAGNEGIDDLKISVKKLSVILRTAGQLVSKSANLDEVSAGMGRVAESLDQLRQSLRANETSRTRGLPVAAHGGDGRGTLDIIEASVRHLSSAIAEIGRLRRIQDELEWSRQQLADTLQTEIVQARMISMESAFGTFGKMVRDIARDEGKEVEFRIQGTETEVDRSVVQMLKDPIMHLLRNAVFHGIERRDTRGAAGKKPVGRIGLRFAVDGSRLEVTVSDDGAGIDFNRVREQLVRSGLMHEEEARTASEDELLRHIVQPGFSTAGGVNRIAGRGIGLSVVRDSVSRLGGMLMIESIRGKGTDFRIDAPLSIAIQRMILVKLGEDRFALPVDGVEHIDRIDPSDIKHITDEPKISYDKGFIDLVPLGSILGIEGTEIKIDSGKVSALILRHRDDRIAIAVDDVLSLFSGMVLDLGLPAQMLKCVSGGVSMEEETVVCVLNPAAIVTEYRQSGMRKELILSSRAVEKRIPTLLVVDDSFTTRTLEKGVLEAHGYRVRIAVDGLDALNQMRGNPVDLVITDIEMPNMDGWGLLKSLRSEKATMDLPIIVVTSREDPTDRKQGMTLGASAYIVKRHFDQRELLETIDRLL